MAELKTTRTDKSVAAYLNSIEDPTKRAECKTLDRVFREVTGEKPAMWGDSIVGYGTYQYVYASGREGDWLVTGFSPRKQAITLYVMSGFPAHDGLMKRLGNFKTGKSCLYVKHLADIDEDVLRKLIAESVEHMRERYVAS
jgi:hypothetical protein